MNHDVEADLTDNTPYMEYSETEIKMLDVGEALLISERKKLQSK